MYKNECLFSWNDNYMCSEGFRGVFSSSVFCRDAEAEPTGMYSRRLMENTPRKTERIHFSELT